MEHSGRIITKVEDLLLLNQQLPELVAADTETYKTLPTERDARLLGLSLSWEGAKGLQSAYIPIWVYRQGQWINNASEAILEQIRAILKHRRLIGWNAAYDRAWLDFSLGITTTWKADGRLMWHLANKDESIRGFGLKLAQKRLLGWVESNDEPLKRNVEAKGGRLDRGDHYLADLPVLAHYAQLDTLSTLLAYKELSLFFDAHDYWHMADKMLKYSFLIKESSDLGVLTDLPKLEEAESFYLQLQEDATMALKQTCAGEIRHIEEGWAKERAKEYKVAANGERFLANPEKWKRFNPGSADQRILLLHYVLKLPVQGTTKKTGRPKSDRSSISMLQHPAAEHLTKHSEAKKLAEMSRSFIECYKDGRIHPGYNLCATVSGRLGGFAPYLLNAPFTESRIMSAFSVEEGYIGVHADLTAIEPCVTAAYSEDPYLLKVYRDSKGDIYLDLALELFPERKDLASEYDPNGPPPVSALKEKYKDLRGVCKIIHLAVGYTGTYKTVSINLTKAGFPTDDQDARVLVSRYWKKFSRVKQFDKKLQAVIKKQGHLRNIMGRIIHVDERFRKDTLNRLVQSSGHDILVEWVFRIVSKLNSRGIDWKPLILDVHDSVTVQVRKGQEELTKAVFNDTLNELNDDLKLGVKIRCDMKTCTSLAGLKGE